MLYKNPDFWPERPVDAHVFTRDMQKAQWAASSVIGFMAAATEITKQFLMAGALDIIPAISYGVYGAAVVVLAGKLAGAAIDPFLGEDKLQKIFDTTRDFERVEKLADNKQSLIAIVYAASAIIAMGLPAIEPARPYAAKIFIASGMEMRSS